jgi:hypothetical protein
MQVMASPQPIASARLDQVPDPGAYLRLPDWWGQRFMLFCDTEEEFDWAQPRSRDNRATTHMKAMPETHRRLHDLGAHSVYLVDDPIVCDGAAVEMLGAWAERGECAIGTQLHPWVNPPFDEEVNTPNSFVGNLPAALEQAKIEALTHAIEAAFGTRPVTYRAGRYGVGPNTADILLNLGYRLDVSVRARFEYTGEGGPDFSDILPLPYWVGSAGGLLEMPLSAAYLGALRGLGPQLFPRIADLGRGALAKSGLLNRVSLTPEGIPVEEALAAVEQMLDEGAQVLSLSYHSPSVAPGHTPFVRDAAELRTFHDWWDKVLGLLARRGVLAATPDDLLAAAPFASPNHG